MHSARFLKFSCRLCKSQQRVFHHKSCVSERQETHMESRCSVRADTCLVWDRWLYPVSRATRYTLFQAPDWVKPCDGKVSHGPKHWNFVRNAIKWRMTSPVWEVGRLVHSVAPFPGPVIGTGGEDEPMRWIWWRVTSRGNSPWYESAKNSTWLRIYP